MDILTTIEADDESTVQTGCRLCVWFAGFVLVVVRVWGCYLGLHPRLTVVVVIVVVLRYVAVAVAVVEWLWLWRCVCGPLSFCGFIISRVFQAYYVRW